MCVWRSFDGTIKTPAVMIGCVVALLLFIGVFWFESTTLTVPLITKAVSWSFTLSSKYEYFPVWLKVTVTYPGNGNSLVAGRFPGLGVWNLMVWSWSASPLSQVTEVPLLTVMSCGM